MPEVIIYDTANIFVYDDKTSVVLNTAPNLTGIDEEIEVNQASNTIIVAE